MSEVRERISKYLEETLKRSLFLESYLREHKRLDEGRNRLLEERGIVPNIDAYIAVFLNFLNKHVNDFGSYTMNQNNFRNIKGCFFNDVNIKIKWKERGPNNGFTNSYIELEEDGKLDMLLLSFNFAGERWEMLQHARTLFAHELTHAYEAWQRLRKKGRSLFNVSHTTRYREVMRLRSSEDSLEKRIGYINYYLFQFETNAYAASIREYLTPWAESLSNVNEAWEIVKSNVTYRNYIIIGEWINELGMMESMAKDIEDIWYGITGKHLSYGKILKKFHALYEKRWNQLRTVIGKACFDVLEKAKAMKQGLSDEVVDLSKIK